MKKEDKNIESYLKKLCNKLNKKFKDFIILFDSNLLNGLIIDLIIIALKLDEKFLESYYNLKDIRNKQQKFLRFFFIPYSYFYFS